MSILTITELLRMTRNELCAIAGHIKAKLPDGINQPEEYADALATLRNIRWVLARRDFSP